MGKGGSRKKRRPDGSKPQLLRPILGLVALVAILAAAYVVGGVLQRKTFGTQEARGSLSSKASNLRTINYRQQTYMYNNGLTTVLLMGVDKTDAQQSDSLSFRNGGQADFLELMIINSMDKTVTWLPIDRDTMTEITVLGVLGNNAGTRTAQISLSHGFGDGKAQSCSLTVQAVETLLYNANVDFFISFDMSAIEALNDAVGGVEVTLEDDLTSLDPAMTKGSTITLQGKQAEYFVRSRMSVGEGTNAERMRRQATFMEAFRRKIVSIIKQDSASINSLLDKLSSHMITNMKRGRMINEANRAKDYAQITDAAIIGEHSKGADGFTEFHPDVQALETLVIDLFYNPVDDAV